MTMIRLFEKLRGLCTDERFFAFQNSVVQGFYDSLGQGYGLRDNEVALVKRLVEVANGKSYGPVRLSARMLHGSRSYVEFNYLDKPVTKELGDMAVISVVTTGKSRLLQKTCIIQNKKGSGNGWSIDLEQLFLLKNFPPFSGSKGIFRGCRDLAFQNASGCLGAFGLLDEPGDMQLVAAPKLARCLHGKKSLAQSDLCLLEQHGGGASESCLPGFPFWSFPPRFHPAEWILVMEKFPHRCGIPPFALGAGGAFPFLGNSTVMLDLYDFVRAWSQLSLGEVSCVRDTITNKAVDAFSNFLLRSAGVAGDIAIPGDNVFGDREFEGQMAVFVLRLDLEHEG